LACGIPVWFCPSKDWSKEDAKRCGLIGPTNALVVVQTPETDRNKSWRERFAPQ
jgi:hypothetical protein